MDISRVTPLWSPQIVVEPSRYPLIGALMIVPIGIWEKPTAGTHVPSILRSMKAFCQMASGKRKLGGIGIVGAGVVGGGGVIIGGGTTGGVGGSAGGDEGGNIGTGAIGGGATGGDIGAGITGAGNATCGGSGICRCKYKVAPAMTTATATAIAIMARFIRALPSLFFY